MQIQRTIQTLDTPHIVIDLPASFAHQRVEILVMILDEAEPKHAKKTPHAAAPNCRASKGIRWCNELYSSS